MRSEEYLLSMTDKYIEWFDRFIKEEECHKYG
jgi:hypothetical protein